MPFPRIFGRHPYIIEIENVVVRFGEPQNRFVATGKPVGSVQAVPEMPDDAVSQFQAVFF